MDDLASVAAELRLIAKGFRQLRLAHAKVELAVHRKPLCRRALVNPPQSLRPPMANRERFISGKALEIAPAEWHPKSLRPAELRFYAGGAPAVNSAGEPMFVDGGLSSRVQGYCSGEHVAAIEDELGRANEWAKRHARVWLGLAPPYGSVMVEGFAWPEVVIRVAESAGLSVLKKPDWMFVVPSNGAHCSVDLWRARKEFDFQYTPEDEAVVGDEPEFVWYTFPSIVRDSELAAGWLAERLEKMATEPAQESQRDGLYKTDKLFVWGGKRYEGLTPNMMKVLEKLHEAFEKGHKGVPFAKFAAMKFANLEGGFYKVFRQTKDGRKVVHEVRDIIEGNGFYSLIPPDQKIP